MLIAYLLVISSCLFSSLPPSFFHFLSFHLCAKHCSSNMVISIEVCVGFTAGSVVKGEGNGNPLQYFRLEDPMDGGAWQAAVHGVTKSGTRLNDFTFTFPFHALEKEVATHSSVLAWRNPGTEEPGGLLSMGSHRVGQD